jgi:hypothetical protein
MTAEERSLLEALDTIVGSEEIRAQIYSIVERVRTELARNKTAQMTWEPIPLTIYGGTLPSGIRSSWVFVLRGGATTGAERHPNSHQRMMSFEAAGDLQVRARHGTSPSIRRTGLADGEEQWQSNLLVSELGAPLERRWISIPRNVWHQVVVPEGSDWVVISFHTVPAEELIEERPDAGNAGGTTQMLYLGLTKGGN